MVNLKQGNNEMQEALNQLITSMTPDIYQRLVLAVETGKWPDGVALNSDQKDHCLQLVMLWQARHNQNPQHMSISTSGDIVTKSKQQFKQDFGIDPDDQHVTRFTLK